MRRHKIKSRLLKVLLEIIKISRKNGLQRISKVFDFKRIVYLFYMVIKNLLSTEYLIMIPVILLYIYMHFCNVGSVHRLNIKRLYVCEPNINKAAKYCAYQVAFKNNFKPKNSF